MYLVAEYTPEDPEKDPSYPPQWALNPPQVYPRFQPGPASSFRLGADGWPVKDSMRQYIWDIWMGYRYDEAPWYWPEMAWKGTHGLQAGRVQIALGDPEVGRVLSKESQLCLIIIDPPMGPPICYGRLPIVCLYATEEENLKYRLWNRVSDLELSIDGEKSI